MPESTDDSRYRRKGCPREHPTAGPRWRRLARRPAVGVDDVDSLREHGLDEAHCAIVNDRFTEPLGAADAARGPASTAFVADGGVAGR